MPTVIVTSDDGHETMREEVRSVHMDDEHASLQVIERLGWAIVDAEGGEPIGAMPYRAVPASKGT